MSTFKGIFFQSNQARYRFSSHASFKAECQAGKLEDSFLICGIDFHFLHISLLICIEICQQRLKKMSTTSLDYRESRGKRASNRGGTGLHQDGELGHEKGILQGMCMTVKAWASEPKSTLLLFSCVTLGKSLGISEPQLPISKWKIQFTKKPHKKIKIRNKKESLLCFHHRVMWIMWNCKWEEVWKRSV